MNEVTALMVEKCAEPLVPTLNLKYVLKVCMKM